MRHFLLMQQYYPGQRVVAADGAQYVLTHWAELTWWGVRLGGACALPQPLVVRYPCWGGDDERAGADLVARRRRLRNAARVSRELRRAGGGARSGH